MDPDRVCGTSLQEIYIHRITRRFTGCEILFYN